MKTTTLGVTKETRDKLLRIRALLDPYLEYSLSFSELLEHISDRFLQELDDDVKLLSFITFINKRREAKAYGGKHTGTN